MPNHIKNVVKVFGKKQDVKEMMDTIKTSEDGVTYPIDFNNVIPTPSNIFQGALGLAEETKYGKENCWYDWNIKNWGTKWNAYSGGFISKQEFFFETAWSAPIPVYQALTKKFPKVKMTVYYADEDRGYNLGKLMLFNGELIDFHERKGNGSNKDKAFAKRVWSKK